MSQQSHCGIHDVESDPEYEQDYYQEQECIPPRHPFFDTTDEQASFIDCIDIIDRVKSMIDLCDCLESNNPSVEPGKYLINELIRGSLMYVSKRLLILNKKSKELAQLDSNYLSAIVVAISELDSESRDQLLNSIADHLKVTRTDIDDYLRVE